MPPDLEPAAAATAPPPSTTGERLWSRSLLAVLAFAFFGFGHENLMQPVLPLLVLDRGGDAVLVGLLVAVYGIPTLLLRPVLGHAVDAWSHRNVMRLGAIGITLAPLGFLIPALTATVAARIAQGIGWSAYGASGHALMARLAPPRRRGEASGYYNATSALSILLMPAAGLWLYANVASLAPFVLASCLAGMGLIIALRVRIPPPVPRGDGHGPTPLALRTMFEPSAVGPMFVTAAFMSVQSLFIAFAPLFANAYGIPIERLALFFPIYGTIVLISQLTLGRVSDRFGRRRTIVAGCTVGVIALLTVGLGGQLSTLILGGGLYGIATALVTSTVGATAIDSAPPGRLGAAMATYSIGYQMGASIGGAIWGIVIATIGFPWPFIFGCGFQILCIAISLSTFERGARTRATGKGG